MWRCHGYDKAAIHLEVLTMTVKPHCMPPTTRYPLDLWKILGKHIISSNSSYTKSKQGKRVCIHKNQDLADLSPVPEALYCMEPVSSILPLLTVHFLRCKGSLEVTPQLICAVGTLKSSHHYFFPPVNCGTITYAQADLHTHRSHLFKRLFIF